LVGNVLEPKTNTTSGRGTRVLTFINLPQKCTIRIYNVRGYLVDTIEHNTASNSGTAQWNLTSKDGIDVAFGIYLYHVDAPGIGTKVGKFGVIK
jgi:hypothetical protein